MSDAVEYVGFARRTWPADPHNLAVIRSETHRWLQALPMTEDVASAIVVAVNEAATNSIEHAYRPLTEQSTVELVFWVEDDVVHISISDHGRWRPRPAHPGGRGNGITLMLRLVESVVIDHDAGGTRVLLRHPLTDEPALATG